jgi:hypothetical protein
VAEIVDQPAPVPNERPAIADLVLADVAERKRLGVERYGVALQAGNGRDALVDGYQEALDLVMYLRQAIEERDQAARFATGGLLPVGARLHIGEDGCTLLVPAVTGLPADARVEVAAALSGGTVEPRTGPDAESGTPEPAEPAGQPDDPGVAVLCLGDGCGHSAGKHASHRSRRPNQIGCWECECPRSRERVLQQPTSVKEPADA